MKNIIAYMVNKDYWISVIYYFSLFLTFYSNTLSDISMDDTLNLPENGVIMYKGTS